MVPYQTDKMYFCFNLKMHSAKSLEQPSKKITGAQNNYKCIKLAKLYVKVILKTLDIVRLQKWLKLSLGRNYRS